MTDSRDRQLTELYKRALELDAAARARLLDEIRAGDPDLAAELVSKLAGSSGEREPSSNEEARDLPERVGGYRILSRLGEGGMGVVYLAEQQKPRRTVALKVLKSGHFSASTRARFEWEAELLGRLQHPGIAQIFEAGTEEVDDGVSRPFFAMERIDGATITEYAEAAKLGTRARVELIVRVCDAVQHAHGRGVVHRDLKPANILVDGWGQPKVLDFGVAKATDAGIHPEGQGSTAEIVGTLTYMAPEQLDPEAELDGRVDVYALGAVLFKLLTGDVPISRQGRSTAATLSAIQNGPARRLGDLLPSPPEDLSCICAKALEVDREARYGSPASLAADLRSFLGHFPVGARQRTRTYALACFARRHLLGLSAIAAVFLVLSVGVTTTAIQWMEARAQAVRSERLLTFFVDRVLSAVSPAEGLGGEVSFAEILARAVEDAEREFAAAPEDLCFILDDIADSFRGLDRVPEALDILERSRALHVELHGEESPQVLINDSEVALLHRRQGDLNAALALARRTADRSEAALGPEHEVVLKCKNDLAVILKDLGRYAEAEVLYREVWPTRERLLGADDPTTLITRGNLAQLMRATGRLREAVPHLEAVLEGHQRLQDPRSEFDHHPDTLISMDLLGSAYLELGRVEEAEALIRESVAGHESVLGLTHDDTLAARYKLAQVLREKGSFEEAVEVGRVSLAASLELNGKVHRSTAYLRLELGRSLRQHGLHPESRDELDEGLSVLRELFPDGHFLIPEAIAELGRIAAETGDPDSAREAYARAIEEAERTLDPDDWRTAPLRMELARSKAAEGQIREAINLVETAVGEFERGLGEAHVESRAARELLTTFRANAER